MPSSPVRRRRLGLFLPFAALALIALAWTVFWFVAANRADAIITAWLDQEAARGRIYRCASRQNGGYPFRIEMRCTEPSLELANAQPVRILRARELRGVAQVYDPGLIIAEIAGPLAVSEAGQAVIWRADWRLAQTSLRGVGGTPERLSVVVEDVKVDQADTSGAEASATTSVAWAAANRLEFHLRRSPAAAPDKPVIDFAAQVAGATVPGAPLLAGRPLDAEVTALISGLAEWRAKPLAARLKDWQVAGGRLDVTRLRLRQGDAVAEGVGNIGLSAAGRPDGTFNVTMAGFERIVQQMVGSSGQGLQLGLLAGLAFLGKPAEIDGKRGVGVVGSFQRR